MPKFCRDHKEMLKADVILVSDTSMIAPDVPSITTGLRGLAYWEVEMVGPNADLHSGIFGGAVANPINVLCKMIGDMIDDKGHITIPGFYDDVLEVSADERAKMAKAPFNLEAYQKSLGIKAVHGEEGFSTNERTGIRPTFDVCGIWGGYTGEGAKTVLPSAYAELPARIRASVRILERAGLKRGDKLLVTYPPLVNVFSGQALKDFGLKWSFLVRSSRDAFLAALYKERPAAVVGESAFLRAALTDAKNMGVAEDLPKGVKLLTAGTPLDLELLPVAQELLQAEVHDLYGCQEIGWLAMDGIPVRDDIELTPAAIRGGQQYYELIAGGLPMGDSFPCSESGHVCNKAGKIITYRRERTYSFCSIKSFINRASCFAA